MIFDVMDYLNLCPGMTTKGRVRLPASKSICNRALLINALSRSEQLPENLSDCDDTQAMLHALQEMPETIDIGAAGTAMRFLTAYLCVTSGTHVITGTERMRHRPIAILVDALRKLGAEIEYLGEEGFPPLRITGCENLEGGSLEVSGDVSSQYVSALLMIAPTLHRGLRLTLTGKIASRPYLEMTITMMREFGAVVDWVGEQVVEVQPIPYKPRPYVVEGDWSAASYWYEIVALSKDKDATVELVGLRPESMQGDSCVWRLFQELGVESVFFRESNGTDVVRLTQRGNLACYFTYDFIHQPDIAQTMVVTCAMLGVPFRMAGLQSLRIKETDRIAALQKELGKLVRLEEKDNELLWDGCYNKDLDEISNHSLEFDTYDDHRMAMSLAPICLRTNCWIQINNPQVVTKSYPAYWTDLKRVAFQICS